jgi:hypothetical protein
VKKDETTGEYYAWFALDDNGNQLAVAMLTAAGEQTEWSVVVKGTVATGNVITVSEISRCGTGGPSCNGCSDRSMPNCGVLMAAQATNPDIAVNHGANVALPAAGIMAAIAGMLLLSL